MYEAAQSIAYVDMVIQESLRMYPAAPMYAMHKMKNKLPIFAYNRAARKTARNIEINGKIFPKGCAIVLPIMAIHYLPEHWPEPSLFRPERFTK